MEEADRTQDSICHIASLCFGEQVLFDVILAREVRDGRRVRIGVDAALHGAVDEMRNAILERCINELASFCNFVFAVDLGYL